LDYYKLLEDLMNKSYLISKNVRFKRLKLFII